MTAVVALSLFDRTQYLESLSALVEQVEPENEEEFLAEFARALKAQIDKIDAASWWLAEQDARAAMIDGEIARLEALKGATVKHQRRVERGIMRTIESLGFDHEGKYRKLEGRMCVFSLAACPPKVDITDQDAVPREFKRLTIQLPAELWDEITEEFDAALIANVQQDVALKSERVDKRAVKEDIDKGYDVPGADLTLGKYRLVRK